MNPDCVRLFLMMILACLFQKNYILLRILFFLQKVVHQVPSSPLAGGQQQKGKEKPHLWKMSCLRPAPPSRPNLTMPEPTGGGNKRNSINAKLPIKKGKNSRQYKKISMNYLLDISEPETNYEEEMQILRVIEAYCSLSASTNKQRHTFSTTCK